MKRIMASVIACAILRSSLSGAWVFGRPLVCFGFCSDGPGLLYALDSLVAGVGLKVLLVWVGSVVLLPSFSDISPKIYTETN